MKKATPLLSLLLGFVLSGCSGAMYAIPKANENDIKLAQSEIAGRPLKKVKKKSHKQKATIIKRIEVRFAKAITPLCQQAGDSKCVFNVKYSKDKTINAYASSNREIVFFSGLADILTNNDEYAAVLAHEMGHHIAGHLKKGQRDSMIGAAIGGILGAVVDSKNPTPTTEGPSAAESGMATGASLGRLTYSKAHEREADYISAYLLARSGYNLNRAKLLWARLAKSGGGMDKKTGIFDTHPAGAERIATWSNVMKEISQNPSLLPKMKGK